MGMNVPQHKHDRRKVFNALRWPDARNHLAMTAAKRLSAARNGLPAEQALGESWVLRGCASGPALDHPSGAMAGRPSPARIDGRTHTAVDLRKRSTRGLRRLQAQKRQQGEYGSRHVEAYASRTHRASKRKGARAGTSVVRDSAAAMGSTVSSRSRLHGREGSAGAEGQRHRVCVAMLSRRQEGPHPADRVLEGEAQLELAGTVLPVGSGLRSIAYDLEHLHFQVFGVLMLPAAKRILVATQFQKTSKHDSQPKTLRRVIKNL